MPGRTLDPICTNTSHAVIVEIYNQIFGAFYSIPSPFSSRKVDDALVQVEQITRYTTTLDCLHLIRSHVGNALLQYRQSLFIAIKSDPARWLLLSLALQNDAFYTLIHMIGAHPFWPWLTPPSTLLEPIRHLISRKSRHLNTACIKAERALLLLTIEVDSGPVLPQCHANSDTWFLVAIFRDILARQFSALEQCQPGPAALKRGRIFRQLRQGGSACMAYEEMERLMLRVMSCAVPSLSEDLGLLKAFASECVRDLARNELMLNVEGNGVAYLACSRVERGDVPWRVADGV
ncbi:hypothetical protein IAQ61_011875 [Plenodomus lingam]|nr:hypothetical protein IAQ61_011875 [Plenodomus lingam]